jgi:uncharacterized repeat protein (TIGR01451 family)
MNPLFKRTPLAAGVLLALSSPVYSPQVIAAQGDPVLDEFPVNTETSNNQRDSSIAMDADGNFVIAWTDSAQDASGYGIYAQRYTADGSPAGTEFRVNTETALNQQSPSIAMDADGDFVIAWQSYSQDASNTDGVYAQRYSADGIKAGAEFQVNTKTSDNQDSPSIAIDADGDFVIAWEDTHGDSSFRGIYAQRYTADGSPAGIEFLVNTFTTENQDNASIAMNAGGNFVIAWESYEQDGDLNGIYAQRYTTDGIKAGTEFQVNSHTDGEQSNPSIAMDADGDFVIAWESYGQESESNDGYGIYAQRYTADGSPAGIEFLVNTFIPDHQRSPSIAMDADDDFVIAWQSYSQDASNTDGVYAQRYSADGTKAGAEFPVNSTTLNSQSAPSIAMDSFGEFVIAWHSYDQDASNTYGIYAQRYKGASQTVDLNLVVQDDVDPVAPGGAFVYSLITTNNGTGTALDVSLSEPLPTGLTYVSDDSTSVGWSCGLTGATVNCSKPFMTVGETNTIQVSVKADADASGTLSSTVTVEAAQTDANAADNTDTETTVIVAGGGGSFSLTPLLLLLPLWFRRRWLG